MFWRIIAMNFARIASRVAKLLPYPELKAQAESMLEETWDEETREILEEIVEEAGKNSSKAYLLWEDLQELLEEVEYAKISLEAPWRRNTIPDSDWLEAKRKAV